MLIATDSETELFYDDSRKIYNKMHSRPNELFLGKTMNGWAWGIGEGRQIKLSRPFSFFLYKTGTLGEILLEKYPPDNFYDPKR